MRGLNKTAPVQTSVVTFILYVILASWGLKWA